MVEEERTNLIHSLWKSFGVMFSFTFCYLQCLLLAIIPSLPRARRMARLGSTDFGVCSLIDLLLLCSVEAG